MPKIKASDPVIRQHIRAAVTESKPASLTIDGCPGLTLTISKTGTATWTLRYRAAGKARELTLARYPELGIAAAKATALEHRLRIQKDGADPGQEKRIQKLAARDALTFAEVAESFLQKVANQSAESTYKHRKWCLGKYILPALGPLPVDQIDGPLLVGFIEKVAKASGPKTAAAVKTVLSRVFAHGIGRKACTNNPTRGLSVSDILPEKMPDIRARLMLTEAEIHFMLNDLAQIVSPNTHAILVLLLQTALRSNELLSRPWSDVDLEDGILTVPTSKTSDKPFLVPLSRQTAAILTTMKHDATSPWIFPNEKLKAKAVQPHRQSSSVSLALRRALPAHAASTRAFTPHDLRSTARSHWARMGSDFFVMERSLNHAVGGQMAQVYDQHDRLDERRELLQTWADELDRIKHGN